MGLHHRRRMERFSGPEAMSGSGCLLRTCSPHRFDRWRPLVGHVGCKDLCVHAIRDLYIGSTAGAPWWDMWDAKITDRMDAVAREQILPLRDDPRLLGYYSDNEMGWWNAILFQMTLEQAPSRSEE